MKLLTRRLILAAGVAAGLVSVSATPNDLRAAEVDTKPIAVETVRAFPELTFDLPVFLTNAGDQSNRVFVLAQKGVIHVFDNKQDVDGAKEFLDISSRVVYKETENEQGLLGLAFHPKFKQNGEFFIYYSTTDKPLTTVISRFHVSKDDPNRADPKSEEELLRITHPYWNHKGGTIAFGPDGYLYVGLGDGGLGADPHENGQNLNTLLGKILRIDVDTKTGDKKYGIPKDNPFADRHDAKPEIYAYGVRNIWRMAFDRQTKLLWAADVGQDLWEEIDIIERGGNYGWNLREARHPFGRKGVEARKDLIDPIWEYPHSIGKSITGGFVYRGKKVPELVSAYLYADYVTGKMWALRYDEKAKKVTANNTITAQPLPVMSFGEDELGEAYFLVRTGTINTFRSKTDK
jgi:quinoprotein glucose dehydrogenase